MGLTCRKEVSPGTGGKAGNWLLKKDPLSTNLIRNHSSILIDNAWYNTQTHLPKCCSMKSPDSFQDPIPMKPRKSGIGPASQVEMGSEGAHMT